MRKWLQKKELIFIKSLESKLNVTEYSELRNIINKYEQLARNKDWEAKHANDRYKSLSERNEDNYNKIQEEKEQNYVDYSEKQLIDRICEFTSRIWQVHPFCEGNTRITAIFIQKYLISIGFKVNNELFKNNSKYRWILLWSR